MRLLHVTKLEFRDFFDDGVPLYAILSHRWGDSSQEVSYADFLAGRRRDTTGYKKIVSFCHMVSQRPDVEWCWVDTCCIDKTSSVELSEAINSMFSWYESAAVCYAYLQDVSDSNEDHLTEQLRNSDWFYRGWTLQELIAPESVIFFNRDWQIIGDRKTLHELLFQITSIDGELLSARTQLSAYSVAQKMSWASRRKTSREEDTAYCLIGIFGVNMPLMYGEKGHAFIRLQEIIMSKTDDDSLFAWAQAEDSCGTLASARAKCSILAPSPQCFLGCGQIQKGFASQRLLFELTNRGIMLLIHRSYDPKMLEFLVEMAESYLNNEDGLALGLTLPLGCFRPLANGSDTSWLSPWESLLLRLVLDKGKWRYVGVTRTSGEDTFPAYQGKHAFAYENNHVRIYIHHDNARASNIFGHFTSLSSRTMDRPIQWMHLRDTESMNNAKVDISERDIRSVPSLYKEDPWSLRRKFAERRYQCKHCDMAFNDTKDLARHSKANHQMQGSEAVFRRNRHSSHHPRTALHSTRTQTAISAPLGVFRPPSEFAAPDQSRGVAIPPASAASAWLSVDAPGTSTAPH